MELQYW